MIANIAKAPQGAASSTPTMETEDSAGNMTRCYGTGAPPTGAGYAKTCLYRRTDGSAGTMLYVNEGSATSATFVPLSTTSAAGDFSVTGNLAVTGNSTFTGDTNVTGNSNTTGNQAVTGTGVYTGILTMNGGGLLGNAKGINTNATGGGWLGGNAAQKAGMHGSAAVQYPANAAGVIVGTLGNGATNANLANATATGNVGSTAYTFSDVVAVLKNKALMAQ